MVNYMVIYMNKLYTSIKANTYAHAIKVIKYLKYLENLKKYSWIGDNHYYVDVYRIRLILSENRRVERKSE